MDKVERDEILKQAHDSKHAAHVGQKATREHIVGRFYWGNIYADIDDYVSLDILVLSIYIREPCL